MIKSHVKSILVYGFLVGVPSTLSDWGTFAFGIYILEWHYAIVSLFAFFCGLTVNALLSRKIAFKSKGRSRRQEMTLLYMAGIISYFINLGSLALFIEIMNILPMIAKMITTFIVFAANYTMRQFFIFDSKPKW